MSFWSNRDPHFSTETHPMTPPPAESDAADPGGWLAAATVLLQDDTASDRERITATLALVLQLVRRDAAPLEPHVAKLAEAVGRLAACRAVPVGSPAGPDSRAGLAADWRLTLNAIADLVGHPRISPDEGHTASIAGRVASLSRDHARLSEEAEARRPDPLEQVAASLEHHEEHHRREAALEKELSQHRQALLVAEAVLGGLRTRGGSPVADLDAALAVVRQVLGIE